MNIKLLRHLIVGGLLLWSWGAPMPHQALAVTEAHVVPSVEYEVKAAFVHNFAKFIEWPNEVFESKTSPFRIGILGSGLINDSLMRLNGKEVQKRPLEISMVEDINEVSRYHVIFVNPSQKKWSEAILGTLQNTGILTIGDMTGFAEQGGVINFYLDSGKVRFEINDCSARRENLKISSRLLRLARIVCTQNH